MDAKYIVPFFSWAPLAIAPAVVRAVPFKIAITQNSSPPVLNSPTVTHLQQFRLTPIDAAGTGGSAGAECRVVGKGTVSQRQGSGGRDHVDGAAVPSGGVVPLKNGAVQRHTAARRDGAAVEGAVSAEGLLIGFGSRQFDQIGPLQRQRPAEEIGAVAGERGLPQSNGPDGVDRAAVTGKERRRVGLLRAVVGHRYRAARARFADRDGGGSLFVIDHPAIAIAGEIILKCPLLDDDRIARAGSSAGQFYHAAALGAVMAEAAILNGKKVASRGLDIENTAAAVFLPGGPVVGKNAAVNSDIGVTVSDNPNHPPETGAVSVAVLTAKGPVKDDRFRTVLTVGQAQIRIVGNTEDTSPQRGVVVGETNVVHSAGSRSDGQFRNTVQIENTAVPIGGIA